MSCEAMAELALMVQVALRRLNSREHVSIVSVEDVLEEVFTVKPGLVAIKETLVKLIQSGKVERTTTGDYKLLTFGDREFAIKKYQEKMSMYSPVDSLTQVVENNRSLEPANRANTRELNSAVRIQEGISDQLAGLQQQVTWKEERIKQLNKMFEEKESALAELAAKNELAEQDLKRLQQCILESNEQVESQQNQLEALTYQLQVQRTILREEQNTLGLTRAQITEAREELDRLNQLLGQVNLEYKVKLGLVSDLEKWYVCKTADSKTKNSCDSSRQGEPQESPTETNSEQTVR